MNLWVFFFRSRAARTDVMFPNLLTKEVFTKTFSLDMTRNVYLGSIYSFFFFAAGNYGEYKSSPLCKGQRMTMDITLGFFFSLSLSILCLLVSSVFFWVGAGGKLS